MKQPMDELIQAYVDGQLPAEVASRFEARLADDAQLRAEIEERREIAALLREGADPFPIEELGLRDTQRMELLRQAVEADKRRGPLAFARPLGLLAAACLAVLVAGALVLPSLGSARTAGRPPTQMDMGMVDEKGAAAPADEPSVGFDYLAAEPESPPAPGALQRRGPDGLADQRTVAKEVKRREGAVAQSEADGLSHGVPATRTTENIDVAAEETAEQPVVADLDLPQEEIASEDDELSQAAAGEGRDQRDAGFGRADRAPTRPDSSASRGRKNKKAMEQQQQQMEELNQLQESEVALNRQRRLSPDEAAAALAGRVGGGNELREALQSTQSPLEDAFFGLQYDLGLPVMIDEAVFPQLQRPLVADLEPQRRSSAFRHALRLARQAGLQLRREAGEWLVTTPRPLPPTTDFGLWPEEREQLIGSRGFIDCQVDRRSTFALDADTASYHRSRQTLRRRLADFDPLSIQSEHFVNAMQVDYALDDGDEAFVIAAEAAPSPYLDDVHLVSIGVVPRPAPPGARQHLRLTLAIDASGSMARPGGLARLRAGLHELIGRLDHRDRLALVVFGERARLHLPFTAGDDHERLQAAIEAVVADGTTNLAEGLALAYQVAAEDADPRRANRVVLITDGATMRQQGADEVLRRLADYQRLPIDMLLLTCGEQPGAPKQLERLVDEAGGRHIFVESEAHARRLFGHELLPEHLAVLGRDAKVQVVWNPERVAHFRLVGYEQRRLAHADFRNEAVGGGALDSQQTVTALYEVQLRPGATEPLGTVQLRYFDTRRGARVELAEELTARVVDVAPSPRLRLLAAAAATAEWLQCGWWSNQRALDPQTILDELARLGGPKARELRELITLARNRAILTGVAGAER